MLNRIRLRHELVVFFVCVFLVTFVAPFSSFRYARIIQRQQCSSNIIACYAKHNKKKKKNLKAYSAKFLGDNGLAIHTEEDGRVTVRKRTVQDSVQEEEKKTIPPKKKKRGPPKKNKPMVLLEEQPAKVVPQTGFNVVLTHCTADFDSLASAVGLAKLWSAPENEDVISTNDTDSYDSSSHVPTFVVLPRGAHPGVQRFLALHKHLFPIRSLKSLPTNLSGLNRLGLVDAQRRDRVGPAEHLLGMAKRVTVVDHHVDSNSDIPEATDYVVDKVGSVSTLIVERLQQAQLELTEAEATLLALGIHADTGSLCYDSTTPRDAMALAWTMEQGASQTAIAEHVQTSLSPEQQGVLTQALVNTNSTVIHGVTVSTVLLSADGFINGLAAVTQDALELSSSDVFLLGLVYEARSGGRSKKGQGERVMSRLLSEKKFPAPVAMMEAEAWKGGEEALRRKRLQAAFDRKDTDHSGFLDKKEVSAALAASGVIASEESVDEVMAAIDTDEDGRIDFEEFVAFSEDAERRQKEQDKLMGHKASTMIIIGRVKAGVNMKSVRLNKLFEPFGGGGHPKAASATVRLNDESEAEGIMQGIVDELIETSLLRQPTVGEFMTAPVLSAKPHMTEKQVEDLFTRYDVRALPVIDDNNDVIGLVTYKEVAAAKQRLWNKEQKRLREQAKRAAEEKDGRKEDKRKDGSQGRGSKAAEQRKLGSALKGWMKQHVQMIDASVTMAEAEAILLANDGTYQTVLVRLRKYRPCRLLWYFPVTRMQSVASQLLRMARRSLLVW